MDRARISVNDLAKACARSADSAEWEEFLRRSAPLASLVAMRVCRMWTGSSSPAVVDDIVQEIFLKLCEQERRILREFEPRGEDSFLGLLRIISASVANDYFRRKSSAKRGGRVVTSTLDGDPRTGEAEQANAAASVHRAVLLAELDQRLRAAPETIGERDRSIFWLYYRHGLTAEEIARLPDAGLTAKGVESALRRATLWLREQIEGPAPAG
ncbi:MAG: sigma-70 family RNA polymerase sigma factor [Terracidiphilus sp.]|jgi:RNA polymerase sigma-70 factor (ECF subfamily)